MADTTPPTYLGLTAPAGSSADFFVLGFDEPVAFALGAKVTLTGSDGSTYTGPAFGLSVGNGLEIARLSLTPGVTYHFVLSPGAVEDYSQNIYSGSLSGDFIVPAGTDVTPPMLLQTSTPQGKSPIATPQLVLQFNEEVKAASGNVTIHNADGSVFQTFAAANAYPIADGNLSFLLNNLAWGATYYVTIDSGAITDKAGNAYAGISSSTALRFTTAPDTTPPYLYSANFDLYTRLALNGNIVITYSEPVVAGSGSITITSLGQTFSKTISITDTSQVTISGATVTINPNIDLPYYDTGYTISMPAGVVKDLAGNASTSSLPTLYTQIDPTDRTAPTLVSFSPADHSVVADNWPTFQFVFNESVKAGSTPIEVHRSDGSLYTNIFIGAGNFSADSKTVQFGGTYPAGSYYLVIPSGAILDLAGNSFAGITDPTALDFTVPWTGPTISSSDFGGKTGVAVAGTYTITFNEAILLGNGNINIYKSGGAFLDSISVSDPAQVRISGNNLIIDPTRVFSSSSSYYFTLDAGAVKDLANEPSPGVTNADALAFTTAPPAAITGGGLRDLMTSTQEDEAFDGGANVDTVAFHDNRSQYTIIQTSPGHFTISGGSDGTDTLVNVEYAKFQDQTVRLYPGTGTSVNFSAAPSTYMSAIRDFDGNDVGSASSWVLLGTTDINHSGSQSHIYTNSANGRWAEVGTAPDGMVYFNDYSWAGATRVVGIYVDPLVQSGQVAAGSANDSQRRFQYDLQIGNISGILGSGDYDGDGYQEVYFKLTDGSAYLHAYMWDDGNIRYANYQSAQQVKDYLTGHGYGASTWGSWFPSSDTLASGPADTLAVALSNPFDSFSQMATPAMLAGMNV